MQQPIRFVGLDVHADSISVAIAEEGREEALFLGRLPNDLSRLLRVFDRVGARCSLRCAYEAGPTGYGLQRALSAAGIECQVIAPSKTPRGSGERVKTDRRDALRIAHFLRSGDLVAIHVPDEACEAMRDLLRAREDAKRAQLRARHQLSKFLLRHGRRFGRGHWTKLHLAWIARQRFEHPAQDTPSEDSSGPRVRRHRITKAGNVGLRRLLVEAAWAYRHRPSEGYHLRKRAEGVAPGVRAIAWKAQTRLNAKYKRLLARGKTRQKALVAVARELAGFLWAVGQEQRLTLS